MRRRDAFALTLTLVSAACSSGEGDIYVGGYFAPRAATSTTDAGTTPAGSNGSSWTDASTPTADAGWTAPYLDAGAASVASEGGSTPGCAGAVVCDDFENQTLGPPEAGGEWSVVTPDCSGTGQIAIDTSQAHSGTHSLRVTGTAGYCNHVFLATSAPNEISGVLWARFYVRLSTPLTSDHATFLAMHDTVANSDLRMGGQDGVLMFNRESDDATLPEMSPMGTALSVAPSVNDWHCVEFSVDGASATLQTWVDGAAVAGLAIGPTASSDADGQWITNTSWAPKLSDARFGWESYAGEAETLWFDDVALGASRIGCE